ncbi:MAG TPA: RHS repeat-associated core domain-containing protein [Candidatus Hydrogenedentes bacterium]|nr:RHS repeat-associated core domain-containing protein [Candidatus Hydrogenedentota bacterium]
MRRDVNRDGDFDEADEGFLYFLADQQYSTVALLDANGEVVERYDYDAFGMPTFYDGAGAGIIADNAKNKRLYTGREYLIAGLYDYRQRIYDSARGRFLIPDPVYDPANLGNPYTYVGNNPGAFVDPYGDLADYVWDAASIGLGAASFGYNISQGSYLSAVVDAVGIGLDVAAFAIPILPGGAGVGLKVYRAADIAVNAGQATAAAIDTGVAISEGDYTGAALAATGTVLQGTHAGVRVGQVKAARVADATTTRTLPKIDNLPELTKAVRFLKSEGITDVGLRREIIEAAAEAGIRFPAISETPRTLAQFRKLFPKTIARGKSFSGRLGNVQTRVYTLDEALKIEQAGVIPRFENQIGSRFVDIASFSPEGKRLELIQLVREISPGRVAAREIAAASEICRSTNMSVKFRVVP